MKNPLSGWIEDVKEDLEVFKLVIILGVIFIGIAYLYSIAVSGFTDMRAISMESKDRAAGGILPTATDLRSGGKQAVERKMKRAVDDVRQSIER